MSNLLKAVILGVVTGLTGLVLSLLPFGLELEENIGLELLFKLRGVRRPPPEVIIVSIDKESADNLGVPDDPRKWPRSFHSRVVSILSQQGAAAIAFDLIFEEPHSAEEDMLFADSMKRARNVVLSELLRSERIPLNDKDGPPKGEVAIVKQIPPIPVLAQSAAAVAPFPLPRVPVRVSQYWTFKADSGNIPTLPIVLFHMFSLDVYDEFVRLLEKVRPDEVEKLPRSREAILIFGIEKLLVTVRDLFEHDPIVGKQMLNELEKVRRGSRDVKKYQMLESLIKMYQSPHSQYLNYYGPSHTITTVPYYQVFRYDERADEGLNLNLRGKVVFVGLSERFRPDQKDGFHTVFSEPSGLDISGVEIAATACANLIENMPVLPSGYLIHLVILLLWGVVTGIVCRLLPAFFGLLSLFGLGILYLMAAEYHFKTVGSWYPIIIPLFVQSPLAFFGAVLWKYRDVNKERKNVKKALGYYLPDSVVEQLSEDIANIRTQSRIVYGICLSTDAEHYTALSESMGPQELSSFMNRYYEAIFEPIKSHGGFVSNVVGDSMLAMWVAARPDPGLRKQACLAAMDIAKAVKQFSQSSETPPMSTRIGLHSGEIFLGSIGAVDHYEYRPVGDIVNTATRLEGLNKYLGSRILVSEDLIEHVNSLLTREIGTFMLLGKSKAVTVHELLCSREDSLEAQQRACEIFREALSDFKSRSWEKAIENFRESLRVLGQDGPSLFYVRLCESYISNPPEQSWDGLIRMDRK
jgi:adenylate cyclase